MGTELQDISNYPYGDDYSQWSPDGRYIVYSRSVSISGPLVIVYDKKNKTETNLTSDGGGASLTPQWAPNGKVYFAYQRPIGSTTATYLMNPDGSDKRKIWTLPSYFYQDSYTFLYIDGTNKVYKTNIDSTINEFVLDLGTLNQYVAIQGFNPNTEELLISPKDTVGTYSIRTKSLAILLTAEGGYTFFQLKYSKDYSKIALIEHSDKDEYLSILQNGVKKRLLQIPASSPPVRFSYIPMQFSADGRYVAFSKQVYNSGQWISWRDDLYAVDINTDILYYIDEGRAPSWNPQP